MKLAEALILRAEVRRRLTEWSERARTSVLVQEGEQPTEPPEALFLELNEIVAQFTELTTRINAANMNTTLDDGRTLTEAIAQRDALSLRANALNQAIAFATNTQPRFGRAEIRSVATIDVAAVRRQAEALRRERRTWDTAIQAANWATEMAE
jgi:hypothetical protein